MAKRKENIVGSAVDFVKWPGSEWPKFIQFFERIPIEIQTAGNVYKITLYNFHQFLAAARNRGKKELDRVIAALPTPLLCVGSFHDDAQIGQACARQAGGSRFAELLALLEKPKLGVQDIATLIEGAATFPWMKDAFKTLIQQYRLHDPDKNGLSSYLKRFGRIRLSRVLYFLVPTPECWPEFERALKARSAGEAERAWDKLSYRPPAYTNFSWHIQATVFRVILLALLYHKREKELGWWKTFWTPDRLAGLGHDGSAAGFNKDTFVILEMLGKRWQARK